MFVMCLLGGGKGEPDLKSSPGVVEESILLARMIEKTGRRENRFCYPPLYYRLDLLIRRRK